jgi:hypothetical protein
MDKGTKTVEMLCNIMADLDLPDASHPTQLYNSNQGLVDWSRWASFSKRLRHMSIREVSASYSRRAQCRGYFYHGTQIQHYLHSPCFSAHFSSVQLLRL